jgi:hypothetical protein
VCSESLNGRDNSEDPRVDGRISQRILRNRIWDEWVSPARNSGRRRALGKTVLNLWVQQKVGNFDYLSEDYY